MCGALLTIILSHSVEQVYDKDSVVHAFTELARHVRLILDALDYYIQTEHHAARYRWDSKDAIELLDDLETMDRDLQEYARCDETKMIPLRTGYARMYGLGVDERDWKSLPPLGSMDTPRVQEDYCSMLYAMHAYALRGWTEWRKEILHRFGLELPPRDLPDFILAEIRKHGIDELDDFV